jgi:hypothetical protein
MWEKKAYFCPCFLFKPDYKHNNKEWLWALFGFITHNKQHFSSYSKSNCLLLLRGQMASKFNQALFIEIENKLLFLFDCLFILKIRQQNNINVDWKIKLSVKENRKLSFYFTLLYVMYILSKPKAYILK